VIIFEIDSSLESFELSGDDLSAAKTYFRQSCFCEELGSLIASGGSIKGTKLNENSWRIDLQMNFVLRGNTETRTISGVFTPN